MKEMEKYLLQYNPYIQKDIKITNKDDIILKIAKEELGFKTLESRKSDSLDFKECGVLSIKRALEKAYKAGQEDTSKKCCYNNLVR